jgi:hypothetical protein
MSLGTVPVEKDGSVFCEAPIEREIYFQALDEHGMAVQSMRSGTYVHPGEHLTCTGCHEDKWHSPPPMTGTPLAFQREPSRLQPEGDGVSPVFFHRHARPIIEAKCMPCHRAEANAPEADLTQYRDDDPSTGRLDAGDLEPFVFYFDASGSSGGSYRTTAGEFGARASRMGQALMGAGHQERMREGHFSREDFESICLWLNANALELSCYRTDEESIAAQRRGEIVWPYLDVDPDNLTGVERSLAVQTPQPRHDQSAGLNARPITISVSPTVVTVSAEEARAGSIEIYDSGGRQLHHAFLRDRQAVIPLAGMHAGMYLLRVTTAGRHYSRLLPIP